MLVASALLVAAIAAAASPVEKGYSSLADTLDASTFVCIGRVTEIIEVRSTGSIKGDLNPGRSVLPFARVAVERVLRGDARTSVVYHEAWGTWMCDTTEAEVGQRALFVLEPGSIAGASEVLRATVHDALGGVPVLRNVGSGDGILTITSTDGVEYVSAFGAPKALWSAQLRKYEFERVLRYCEELLCFSLESVSVHALAWEKSSFDLRILPDGRARLATQLGPDERVSAFRLDPHIWTDLRRDLESATAGRMRSVGTPGLHASVRRLALRFETGGLTLTEPAEGLRAGSQEDRLALQDALRAWSRVRAVIDCPDCADHSERDRALLQGR
jgi:hypothetical protein